MKQTHQSLRQYVIEEAYEVADAIERGENREIFKTIVDFFKKSGVIECAFYVCNVSRFVNTFSQKGINLAGRKLLAVIHIRQYAVVRVLKNIGRVRIQLLQLRINRMVAQQQIRQVAWSSIRCGRKHLVHHGYVEVVRTRHRRHAYHIEFGTQVFLYQFSYCHSAIAALRVACEHYFAIQLYAQCIGQLARSTHQVYASIASVKGINVRVN